MSPSPSTRTALFTLSSMSGPETCSSSSGPSRYVERVCALQAGFSTAAADVGVAPVVAEGAEEDAFCALALSVPHSTIRPIDLSFLLIIGPPFLESFQVLLRLLRTSLPQFCV